MLGSVRGAQGNLRPLYVAACSTEIDIALSSKESGEPRASLWSENLCGRYGPAVPSSAVHAGRYPGTRQPADPAYKVARRGALPWSLFEVVERRERCCRWNRCVQENLGRQLRTGPAKAGQDLRKQP